MRRYAVWYAGRRAVVNVDPRMYSDWGNLSFMFLVLIGLGHGGGDRISGRCSNIAEVKGGVWKCNVMHGGASVPAALVDLELAPEEVDNGRI